MLRRRDRSFAARHRRLVEPRGATSDLALHSSPRSRRASHSMYGSAAGRRRLRTAICPAPYKSRATPASGAIRRAMVKRSTRPFLGNIIIPPPWEGDRATIGPNQWNSGKALIQWVFLGVNPSGVAEGADQNLTGIP